MSKSGEALATAMYARFSPEVPQIQETVQQHYEPIQATGLGVEGTTSIEDCVFLYLLIRHFRRKHVFEIGTYIGTTAVAMNSAVKKNGGVCTTTDPKDYGVLPPWSGIRLIEGPAEHGLGILKREGHSVDFAFADWYFQQPTIDLALTTFTEDCIIAVHDYFPNDKGEENVAKLNATYCRERPGEWLLPIGAPWKMDSGASINICTAVFVPHSIAIAHRTR